jgi:DNA-binding NtrC family response regulator
VPENPNPEPSILDTVRLTRVTNASRALAGARAARLRVIAGPGAGTEVEIPPIGVVVGADPAADVVIDDDAVSGRHCTVVPGADGFEVTDLESRNGTHIDGVAVTKASVPVGATLRLGRTSIQLLPAEQAASVAPSDRDSFGDMLGSSLAIRAAYALLERAARTTAPVLLLGESGTGKELAARALHAAGPRADGPFVVFDCGAASDTLVDSALFGHARGAFTGATADRAGAFAAAAGGTLLLDEIGDFPLSLQPKLLRMLEAGEITPLGRDRAERHDVRVIAATHRDLYDEVGRGGFRADLYYRLAVVEVELPPLRARLEDLPLLADRFLAAAGSPARVEPCANFETLRAYHWPGNVRELRNVISRAVALAEPGAGFAAMPILLRGGGGEVKDEVSFAADRSYHQAKAEVLGRFERRYLADLLRRAGGNISEAARIAGVERKHLYKMLERAGVER